MKKFFLNSRGTSTVEFALTVFAYFLVVAMIIELGRVALASAYFDLAIAQSVTEAKNQKAADTSYSKSDYKQLFEDALDKAQKLQRESPMGYLAVQEEKISIDVKYADSIEDLLNENFRLPKKDKEIIIEQASGLNATIAVYFLAYSYEFLVPIPFSLDSSIRKTVFNRSIVTVQEYEK